MKADLIEYFPILVNVKDYNPHLDVTKYLIMKFLRIDELRFANSNIENTYVLKINHCYKGKNLHIIFQCINVEDNEVKISIFVPEKIVGKHNIGIEFLKNYLRKLFKLPMTN